MEEIKCEPIIYDDYNGRMRVDQDCIGTLTTNCGNDALRNGVKIIEPRVMVVGNYSPSGHNASSIVDTKGITPTVMENHGTVTAITEPRIAAMRGRNPENPSDRTAGSPTEQRLEIGSEETSNTLTTVQKDNLVVEPTFIERAIRESNGETMSFDPSRSEKFGYRKPLPIARTLRAENNSAGCVIEDYRIRKLTERECFRLMGVKQEDFERVAQNQSTSSSYHLAGDSIVTAVLMAIFGQLFGVDYNNKINELVGELRQ